VGIRIVTAPSEEVPGLDGPFQQDPPALLADDSYVRSGGFIVSKHCRSGQKAGQT